MARKPKGNFITRIDRETGKTFEEPVITNKEQNIQRRNEIERINALSESGGTSAATAIEAKEKETERIRTGAETLGLKKEGETTTEGQQNQEVMTAPEIEQPTTESIEKGKKLSESDREFLIKTLGISTDTIIAADGQEVRLSDQYSDEQLLQMYSEFNSEAAGVLSTGLGGVGRGVGVAAEIQNPVISFLTKAFSKGGQVTKAEEAVVITTTAEAPSKLRSITKAIRNNPIIAGVIGGAVVGIAGKAKSFSNDILLREIKKMESSLGKLGEQMSSIDATAKNGFYVDENGKVKQYTTRDALKDLDENYETLIEAEQKIQQANIYQQFYLWATGDDITIMAEIDKLKQENREATSDVLQTIINPPESLTLSQDFFRRLELEGYNVG